MCLENLGLYGIVHKNQNRENTHRDRHTERTSTVTLAHARRGLIIIMCLEILGLQWNPSIVATIGERLFGHYRGVAASQGVFFLSA